MIYFIIAAIIVVAALYLNGKTTKKENKEDKKDRGTEMPYGIQVFSPTGEVMLDTSDRIVKFIGETDINRNNAKSPSSGIVYDSKIGEGDLWYVITCVYLTGYPPTNRSYEVFLPVITKVVGGVKWEYTNPYGDEWSEWDFLAGVHIIYGVY